MFNNYLALKRAITIVALFFISILHAQECQPPTSLAVGSTGMNNARFYWTSPQNSPSMGYQWELTLPGDTGIVQSGTTQNATLLVLNLSVNTTYHLKVRSYCTETSNSTWMETNFTTKNEFTINEGQIGDGTDASAVFGASYGPLMYATIAQRNGSVANMLFTQAEMQSAGIPSGAVITKVAFEKINGAYGGDAYPDLRLRMFAKNSSTVAPLSMSTTYGDISGGHTEVTDNPAYDLPATIGWIDFPFEEEFTYTGNSFEFATAMYQNGQTVQFSNFIVWQFTSGYRDYMIGAWPINTVPMSETLLLNHNSGAGQYRDRPNIKIFYKQSNAVIGLIAVPQNGAAAQITQNQGTLQLTAVVSPGNASQERTWQIISGNEFAAISETGLLTATGNGTVTVQAVSADNPAISDTLEITISGQIPNPTGITITTLDNIPATITNDNGTLQLNATVVPAEANQEVVWSVVSGSATINESGLVTAVDNGTAILQAMSTQDNTVLETIEVTITGQIVAVAGITISVENDAEPVITTDDGTLQLISTATPSNSNQNVVWSTISGNAYAYMTQDGIVHALNNGVATIQAVSTEDNTILDNIEISITGQIVAITGITISVENDAEAVITTDDGTLQLTATAAPSNSNQNVVWSTISGNAYAYMTQDGIVHALNNGVATIQAVSAEDNTILDTIEITITGQIVAVTGITISVENDAEPVITTNAGTLQLIAAAAPANSNQNVIWSTISGNAYAYMTQDGIVHAINNGVATIQAVSAENNTILDTIEVTVSGQVILGLDEFSKDDVIIYPNPAQTVITLQSQYEINYVAIYAFDGKKVMEGYGTTLNITALPQGHYIIKAITEDGRTMARKIIKN